MPVPLIALFAASLHEASVAGRDPASYARAVSLLARAVGGSAVNLVVDGDALLVNGIPVPAEAPGVPQVIAALTRLRIGGVSIPANVEAARWRDLVELFVAAPALYSDLSAFLTALTAIAPQASVLPAATARPFDTGRPATLVMPSEEWGGEALLTLGTTDIERSDLSLRLDPILERGRAALDANDDTTLAEVLLELHHLHVSPSDAVSVRAERRRLASPRVLEAMARRLTEPHAPVVIAQALATFGAGAADAIIEVMPQATSRAMRRAYIAALAEMPDAEAPILAALTGTDPRVVADVAEAAGRRMMESAIPTLARLLKHHEEEVRTGAWHALEQIGTPAAQRALAP